MPVPEVVISNEKVVIVREVQVARVGAVDASIELSPREVEEFVERLHLKWVELQERQAPAAPASSGDDGAKDQASRPLATNNGNLRHAGDAGGAANERGPASTGGLGASSSRGDDGPKDATVESSIQDSGSPSGDVGEKTDPASDR